MIPCMSDLVEYEIQRLGASLISHGLVDKRGERCYKYTLFKAKEYIHVYIINSHYSKDWCWQLPPKMGYVTLIFSAKFTYFVNFNGFSQ